MSLTLYSCFSTNCRCEAQRACHKVGKDLIGAWISLGRIFAEIWDLQGRAVVVVVGANKGALRGWLVLIANSPLLLPDGSQCECRRCMSVESILETLWRGHGKHDAESWIATQKHRWIFFTGSVDYYPNSLSCYYYLNSMSSCKYRQTATRMVEQSM